MAEEPLIEVFRTEGGLFSIGVIGDRRREEVIQCGLHMFVMAPCDASSSGVGEGTRHVVEDVWEIEIVDVLMRVLLLRGALRDSATRSAWRTTRLLTAHLRLNVALSYVAVDFDEDALVRDWMPREHRLHDETCRLHFDVGLILEHAEAPLIGVLVH